MAERAISVHELKERLSHYLQIVRAGETVVVTHRGTPVARLVPTGRTLQQQLSSLREAGLIEWNEQKLYPSMPPVKVRQGSISEILVEERR
ncbi:MAG: antitoxin [Armatimonadota bacterium]|jgi:prevent-host-death family protein|nr:MAG: antitoxin [Armatimonadota bacterium]